MVESWLAWSVVAAVLFVVELLTPSVFFLACFGLGAASAAVAAANGVPPTGAWAIFLGVSGVAFALVRPLVIRLGGGKQRSSNVDALIGAEGVVVKAVGPMMPGVVQVSSEEWRARSGESLNEGEVVIVEGVGGASLDVRRKV